MKKTLLLAMTLLLPISSAGAVMPVIDWAAITRMAQQLEQMKKQYTMLKSQYDTANKAYNTATSTLENAKSQLKNAESQLATVTKLKDFNSGHYQLGNLKNSLTDLTNRQWSPNNWEDALKSLAGGNKQRYNQLVESYRKSHPEVSEQAFEASGATKAQIAQYQQSRAVNEAVVVQTTYAFDDINAHLKTVHELSQEIENTENTKSALDLNSRLITEMAYIQIQTLKLQTLISQQTAQNSASNLSQTAEQVRFNRLPDDVQTGEQQ